MIPSVFLILFTVFIIYFSFGIYTLLININSSKNRVFFFICISLSFWALGDAFMSVAPNETAANQWRLASAFGWCFIPSGYLDFAILVKSEHKKWISDIKRLLMYIPSIFFYIGNFKYEPNEVIIKLGDIWKDEYPLNLFQLVFIAYYLTYTIVGILIIYKWGKNTSSSLEKKQSKVIVITTLLTFVIVTFFEKVLLILNIRLHYHGIIAFSILLFGMWYSITKYKMMTITTKVASDYILETMNDPVILIDNNLLIKEANSAALKITGYSKIGVIGVPIQLLIKDTEKSNKVIEELLIEGKVKNYEVGLLTKSNEYIPCLLSAASINDNIRGSLGIVCILHDITDRKNAEKALERAHKELENKVQMRTVELEQINRLLEQEIYERQRAEEKLKSSEEKYRSVMKQATNGILLVDSHSLKVIESNEEACNILGYTEEELSNITIDKILPAEWEESMARADNFAEKKDKMIKEIIIFNPKNSALKNVGLLTSMVGYGKKKYIMMNMADITETIIMGERKRQMAKMESLGTLAGGIAHDFNNILAGIIGYTQLSLEDAKEGLYFKENLQEVLKLGERAKKLISQILTFSRKSIVEPQIVDMKDIIEEILKMLKATVASSIEMKSKFKATSANVFADSGEMQQLIMNLCVNAELAMRDKGGTLQVEVSEIVVSEECKIQYPGLNQGEYIEIKVIDDGCGMEKSTIERIFEPFFTTRGVQGGTGLGLSAVHGIVRRYDGLIKVDSELNKGSQFTVLLPAAKEHLSKKVVDRVTIINSPARILFVDDEESIVNTSKKLLQSEGYVITGVLSGKEALDLFRGNENSFDIVITDQSMPDMKGDALLKELRAIRPDIPVILCSGYSHEIDDENMNPIGITEFLLKPLSKIEYIRTIEKIMKNIKLVNKKIDCDSL